MAKIVRYNGGGTAESYDCTSPIELVVGKEYDVIIQKHVGHKTYYILNGVNGKFDSLWFDDVSPKSPAYMALSHTIPSTGKRFVCTEFEFVGGMPMLGASRTITAKEVMLIGSSIYRIVANDGIYIVKVG